MRATAMSSLRSYRTLGTSGLRVSPLALGTMTFDGSDEETAHQIIDRYTQDGGNFLDTANGYSRGRSEETIGAYLAKHDGLRDRLVLSTKFAGNLFAGDPNGGGGGRKAIVQQVEGSLRRLGTDYIDLYWLHNHDRHTPIEETMSTLDDLVRAGKIRYIGLSDTPAWEVARAATIAQFRGWANVAAIQVEYSLLERTVEGELFGAARELGLGVTPWSPLAGGVLSGKYSRDTQTPEDSARAAYNGHRLTDTAFDVLDALQHISADLKASVAAVALAWVRQQDLVTSTIIGARTLPQLEANQASLDVTLTAENLAELDALTTPQLNFPFGFLASTAPIWQQNGATINGITSPTMPG